MTEKNDRDTEELLEANKPLPYEADAAGGEAPQRPDYPEEIAAKVRSNLSPTVLREALLSYHENDLAEALSLLTPEERGRVYNLLDAETLSEILGYTEDTGTYFEEMSIRKKVEILTHSEADLAVFYLRQLPKAERTSLIDLMDDDAKRQIALIGSFDEDEIGSRMTTNYISVRNGLSVKQAMRELISQAAEHDNISTIYVTDEKGIFYGAIDLKDLIVAREGTPLETLIVTSYPYVYAHEAVKDCVEALKDYSEDSVPVLDDDNRILGAITSKDLLEVVDDEMGEDYAKLAGLSAQEDLRESVPRSMGKRLPWLIILLGLGLVVSAVVGLFEKVVAQLTLIVCFQSLILDMAGNVGTQSLAVTIRVLTGDGLTAKQKARLVFKEARIGLFNGMILGAGSFLLVGLYLLLLRGETARMSFSVSACTGTALLCAMFLSGILGTVIPLLFKKCRIDPAVASGPLITTLNDLVAVVTYYGLSWIFLIQTLHL